jgi:RNA polymerase sigma-70 factor, ECF subfamily
MRPVKEGLMQLSTHPRRGAEAEPLDQTADASSGDTLVDQARHGDHVAFGALARQHRPALHEHLLAATGSEAMTEELVAETFLQAWSGIVRGARPAADFEAWLIVVAHRATAELLASARGRRELTSGDMRPYDQHLEGADTTAEASWTREAVREAMGQLSDVQRAVLVQRFYEGQSIAEVARHLGRSEGAVKQLQLRGVRRLSRLLPRDARSA